MSLNDKLEAVYKKAMAEQWNYPQLFNGLKQAGVRYYTTDVLSHTIEYFGDQEQVTHPGPADFKATLGQYNEAGVIEAIRRTQRREIDYATFLKQIAASGISHYRVDMTDRTIAYMGDNEAQDRYTEKVP